MIQDDQDESCYDWRSHMFPPRVILAAVDFSEASRVALTFAARLAKQCEAELHVLYAEDPLLAAAAKTAGMDLTGETRDELSAFMQTAAPAADWTPIHHVITGPPVEVIRDIAARERADVIVAGMRGMSGAQRAMFGSTTEGILRNADTSVLVVPDDWTPPQPESPGLAGTGPIVAAVDMSSAALAAARAACDLAAALGTQVEAVHVVPPLAVPRRWSAHADAATRQRIDLSKAELAAALHELTTQFSMRLEVTSGRIAEALADSVAASPGRHPVLVMGRRTHDERGGAPGSTAYRFLTLAAVPVLMYLPER
jgi:nucleotide-binding universal stress UspA family protein